MDNAVLFFRAAADLLLPRSCMICGRKLLLDERQLCLSCLADLPLTYFWSQDRNPMADRFNEGLQAALDEGRLCGPERYAYACALFFYNDDAECRHIPHQIKYQGNMAAGRYFGRLLGEKLTAGRHFSDVGLVIPVPLHWRRKWRRGYNQAELIAEGLAEKLGIPLYNRVLLRTRHTQTQTQVDVKQKEENVRGAFELSQKDLLAVRKAGHILLVDDIFTTGSTLTACFCALRTALPCSVRISVATLGFVGGA